MESLVYGTKETDGYTTRSINGVAELKAKEHHDIPLQLSADYCLNWLPETSHVTEQTGPKMRTDDKLH
jgi:hypothetical protein